MDETICLDNQRFNPSMSQSNFASEGPRSAMVSSQAAQTPTANTHGIMGVTSTTTHFPQVSREISTGNALLNVQGRRGL